MSPRCPVRNGFSSCWAAPALLAAVAVSCTGAAYLPADEARPSAATSGPRERWIALAVRWDQRIPEAARVLRARLLPAVGQEEPPWPADLIIACTPTPSGTQHDVMLHAGNLAQGRYELVLRVGGNELAPVGVTAAPDGRILLSQETVWVTPKMLGEVRPGAVDEDVLIDLIDPDGEIMAAAKSGDRERVKAQMREALSGLSSDDRLDQLRALVVCSIIMVSRDGGEEVSVTGLLRSDDPKEREQALEVIREMAGADFTFDPHRFHKRAKRRARAADGSEGPGDAAVGDESP